MRQGRPRAHIKAGAEIVLSAQDIFAQWTQSVACLPAACSSSAARRASLSACEPTWTATGAPCSLRFVCLGWRTLAQQLAQQPAAAAPVEASSLMPVAQHVPPLTRDSRPAAWFVGARGAAAEAQRGASGLSQASAAASPHKPCSASTSASWRRSSVSAAALPPLPRRPHRPPATAVSAAIRRHGTASAKSTTKTAMMRTTAVAMSPRGGRTRHVAGACR